MDFIRSRLQRWPIFLVSACLAACSARAQRPAIETAWDDPEVRGESFEATLRVLDEHPEYVEEFFAAAQRHPATLEKFLDITARELDDETLAQRTADRLVAHPPGLQGIMIATLDASMGKPEAQDAIAKAMESRPEPSAAVIMRRDQAMRATFTALIGKVADDDAAQRSFVASMSENSTQLARMLAENPTVLRDFVKALVKVGVRKGKAELEAYSKVL